MKIGALSFLLCIFATTFLTAQNDQNSEHELMEVRVVGNSMYPTISPGSDVLVWIGYPYSRLRKGDIVVVQDPGCNQKVIHRIHSRYRANWYNLKGDNNREIDESPLSPSNFVGLAIIKDSTFRLFLKQLNQSYLKS